MAGKFDALIFDMDGTLWDSCQASANGYNRAYRHFNINRTLDGEFIRLFSGKTASEYNHLLLDGIPEDIHEELLMLFDKFENDEVRRSAAVSLYPDVKDGFAKLSKKFKLCVVSNCGAEFLKTFLNFTGLKSFITDSECYGNNFKSKAENILAEA